MPRPSVLIRLTEFRPDPAWRHVAICDPDNCRQCRDKNCLLICPAGVFTWDNRPDSPIQGRYERCVECGACRLACPAGAVEFTYPRGGYGVIFRQG